MLRNSSRSRQHVCALTCAMTALALIAYLPLGPAFAQTVVPDAVACDCSGVPWSVFALFAMAVLGAVGLSIVVRSDGRGAATRRLRTDLTSADVIKAATGLDAEAAKIAEMFADSSGSHARYASSLAAMEGKIAAVTTQEQLRAIANTLAAENVRMRVEAQAMAESLEASRARIDELSSSLADVEEQIMRDPLTGVVNRRGFDATLQAEITAAGESEAPLSLAMIDIDAFKAINDRHGHVAGDQVLAAFARVLSGQARDGDTVARYGGEEFALIMPKTTNTAASVIAERFRQKLMAERFDIGASEPMSLTASIGVAALRSAEGSEQLVRRADSRLYKAKEQGRNRVVTT